MAERQNLSPAGTTRAGVVGEQLFRRPLSAAPMCALVIIERRATAHDLRPSSSPGSGRTLPLLRPVRQRFAPDMRRARLPGMDIRRPLEGEASPLNS